MTWLAEHFYPMFALALALNFADVGCFYSMALRRRQLAGESEATFGNLLLGRVEWNVFREFAYLGSGSHLTAGDTTLTRLVWATRLILAPALLLMITLFVVAFSGESNVG